MTARHPQRLMLFYGRRGADRALYLADARDEHGATIPVFVAVARGAAWYQREHQAAPVRVELVADDYNDILDGAYQTATGVRVWVPQGPLDVDPYVTGRGGNA